MRLEDGDLRALERLAALDLDEAERAELRRRLARLGELLRWLEGVEPLEAAEEPGRHGLPRPLREDEPGPFLGTDAALAPAPRRHGDHFDLPAVDGPPS